MCIDQEELTVTTSQAIENTLLIQIQNCREHFQTVKQVSEHLYAKEPQTHRTNCQHIITKHVQMESDPNFGMTLSSETMMSNIKMYENNTSSEGATVKNKSPDDNLAVFIPHTRKPLKHAESVLAL
ncbi:unnamed protein product [Trichobilharzia szidati]|nr:unnamed protein product [Trichobilharzia szidati]